MRVVAAVAKERPDVSKGPRAGRALRDVDAGLVSSRLILVLMSWPDKFSR